MDVYRNVEQTAQEVADAHERDVEVGRECGVDYQKYWIDEDEGAVCCLFEGSNAEAGAAGHREAHGLEADEIYEVEERGLVPAAKRVATHPGRICARWHPADCRLSGFHRFDDPGGSHGDHSNER